MTRLVRAIPFAVAAFMLTPLLLWAVLWSAGGLRGIKSGFDGPEAVVLILASVPLAGLFWVRNLREMGDSLGRASRLRLAAVLTVGLPAAVLAAGAAGLVWLGTLGRDALSIGLVGAGVAAVALFAALAASRAGERPSGRPVEGPGWRAEAILLFLGNVAMALALLAFYWTPAVLFWAAVALVPVAFVVILLIANQQGTA